MASKKREQRRECRVCGNLYIPCTGLKNDNLAFNWKAVACSPECGSRYFATIEETRNTKGKSAETVSGSGRLKNNKSTKEDTTLGEVVDPAEVDATKVSK